MKQDELMSRLFATSSKQILWMSSIRMFQPGRNFNRVKILTLDKENQEWMLHLKPWMEWKEWIENNWQDIFRWMQNPWGTGTTSGSKTKIISGSWDKDTNRSEKYASWPLLMFFRRLLNFLRSSSWSRSKLVIFSTPINPDLIEISGNWRWLLVTKQRNIESEL